MKRLWLFTLCALTTLNLCAQMIAIDLDTDQPSFSFRQGADVLLFLHQRHRNAPCKAYTFSQKNTHYRNDSVTGTSEWHEAIEFPDKFRIDFGDASAGNYLIFRNDSAWRYKNHELKTVRRAPNTLLLLLGGMYYRELPDVETRLKLAGYNLEILSKQRWKKQRMYVIGAETGDLHSNQIWVNRKTWRIERIIEQLNETDVMDMSFDSHQPHCNGYVETRVTFKRNGKTEQVEEYHDIETVEKFEEAMFKPIPLKK